MNSPRIYAFATVIGLIGLTAGMGGVIGISDVVSGFLYLVALALVVVLILHARSVTGPSVPPEVARPTTPPPPPPPPPPEPMVVEAEPERSDVSQKVLGVTCPKCGYRFTEKMLPRHMEIVHKVRPVEPAEG